jgi:hypothetical protein
MRKPWRTVAVLSAFAAAILTVSALYADTTHDRGGSMMGGGGMMSRMGQMRSMMESCSSMMGMGGGDADRPNDQWRKPAPSAPEKAPSVPEKKS